MLDNPVALGLCKILPAKAIRMGLAIGEFTSRPHLLQLQSLQQFLGIQCGVRLRQNRGQ